MTTGSCLCGGIVYQLSAQPFDCCYCHCGICRKLTGSSGGAYGSVRREHFAWQVGQDQLRKFQPTPDTVRMFCADCGSFLLTEHVAEPQHVFISLGCLDSAIDSAPQYRQFVADAADWVALDAKLPQHSQWPQLS